MTSLVSMCPSDTMWWCRSGSISTQVMICCLPAPRHYLKLVEFSLRFSCTDLRIISQRVLKLIFSIMGLKTMIYLYCYPPGANELKYTLLIEQQFVMWFGDSSQLHGFNSSRVSVTHMHGKIMLTKIKLEISFEKSSYLSKPQCVKVVGVCIPHICMLYMWCI